jgi:pyruvate/2-oxoglutarate dehydrogenase complex dihydrolipoamide dehydrogenase (E3) component
LAELLRPDICVIGAGAGGLTVASAAAAFGVPVVLVENHKMGGDCLNYGCVPSKALIAAANRAHDSATAAPFGIDAPPLTVFARSNRHVHNVIAAIAPNDSKERFTGLGVRVVSGTARFTRRDTVAVEDIVEIKARRFVIATGSTPTIPPIPGLDATPHFTNETIFDLAELPAHLVVVGGGPVGLELAQAFRRLGAAATVIEALRPLAKDDQECAGIVLDALKREGVAIRTGATVQSVRQTGGGIEVTVKSGDTVDTVTGSHLLIAAGRTPKLDGLGLEAAGIAHGPTGVTVNGGLKTTNRRVYAIGDAAGGPMFTHVANYHAALVIRNALFRLRAGVRYNAVPWVTFTDPELAHVGLNDEQAKQQGHRIRVLRWPYRENDRAQAERATQGHVKVVTTRRGRILGATIVGAGAGELIAPWTLAIDQGLDIRAVAQVVVPYPTRGEAGKRAALSYFASVPANPFVRRAIRWLRRLG